MTDMTHETSAAPKKAPTPLRPIVVVGLGGTGRWLCSRLKRLYRERLGGVPPHVALLSIDSVRKQSFDSAVDTLEEPGEVLSLSIANVHDYVNKISEYSPWFPRDRSDLRKKIIEVNQHGCGATRPIGRVLFEANWTTIHTRLRNLSEQVSSKILRARDNPTVQAEFAELGFTDFDAFATEPSIIICGNLVSGTGSGAFLETAYIARLLPSVRDVIGIFTLPPEADQDVQHLVNATAALRELQHYMAVDSLPAELRYHCQTIAAEPFIRQAPSYNHTGPYTSLLLARPHLSDPKELERLQEQAARFLYGFTATPLGLVLAERTVNLSTNATITGDVPVICSFGAYELEDDSTQRGRLLHLMLADFFGDDITGRFNPGEQQKHTTWTAHELIPTATEHLRMVLGLPSAAVDATPFSPDLFIASCSELLEHVRTAAMRRANPRIFGRDVQLESTSIANAILSDPLVRAAKSDAKSLQQNLIAQIPRALKDLDPALDSVLTEVVEGRLRELLAAITKDLFEAGASLDQTLAVIEQVLREVDHLARRIPEVLKRQLEVIFTIDNIAATLKMLAAKKVNNFIGETVFLDELKSEINAYLNRKLAGVATRIIQGEPGQSVPALIAGVQFDLAAGLSKNLQTIIDTLRKVQKVIESAGVRLEDEGNLRDARDVASEPEIQSLYAHGVQSLLANVREVRRTLLHTLKCTDLIGAANVEPATMAQHLKNVTAALVPQPERKPFARLWAERGIRTIDETTLASTCSLLPFSEAAASGERYDMGYAIAIQSPAGNDEPPLRDLRNIPRAGEVGPILNEKDNSVRLMVIRGRSMLRWMVNFERLTANYAFFQSDTRQMETAHTVAGFERLRPIVFGRSDRTIWYLVGCAIGLIVPTQRGAIYRYRDSNSLTDEHQQWQYCTSEDIDDDRGPILGLFTKVPLPGSSDGPPTALLIQRPGTTATSAASLYQHLQWSLNAKLLDPTLSQGERRQRATDLYRLLALYFSHLGSSPAGIESAHLDPKLLKTIDMFGWTSANFGNVGNNDTLLNELRWEIRQTTIRQLIARYRAAIAFDIEEAPPTAPKAPAILPDDPTAPNVPIRGDSQRRDEIYTFLSKVGLSPLPKLRIVKAFDVDIEQMVRVAEEEGLAPEHIDALARLAAV
jgi:hypothetical protein